MNNIKTLDFLHVEVIHMRNLPPVIGKNTSFDEFNVGHR